MRAKTKNKLAQICDAQALIAEARRTRDRLRRWEPDEDAIRALADAVNAAHRAGEVGRAYELLERLLRETRPR